MTGTTQEPWQWEEPIWRAYADHVSAGTSLAPSQWPGGAKAAVALSFDSDHETTFLRDGNTSPGQLAQGAYGSRAGLPRILDLLDTHRIPSTFYVPAVSALLHPEDVRNCSSAGHEVALHGWIHERNLLLPREAERDLALRASDTLERLSGTRPVGIRTPSWDFSASTMEIVIELGLRYDSSLMADDDPYELLLQGEGSGVVEIPVDWIRDDAPYFMMDRYTSLRPYTPPRDVLTIWKDEFLAAYEAGGVFQLTLHPHIIGHRSRMVVLGELIGFMNSFPDLWYATHAQVADHVASGLGER